MEEMGFQDLGIVGVLGTVIVMIVRDVMRQRNSTAAEASHLGTSEELIEMRAMVVELVAAVSTLADSSRQLMRMHEDSDSKFSTVGVTRQLTALGAQVAILVERSARSGG